MSGSSERNELLQLARSLRRRAEASDESEWNLTMRATSVSTASTAKASRLAALAEKIRACRQCPLGQSRLNAVPGIGSPDAQVLFVGEGPGFQEDHEGEPFVGRSGKLLDKIMESIGLSRTNAYIANIVKCHPMKNPDDPQAHGNDRPPTDIEIAACRSYLDEQIRVITPRVIVTLGAVPARVLLGTTETISKIRGTWRVYEPADAGPPVKLLPTYHPAALLRNPNLKKDVWTDMKTLRQELQS